MNSTIRLRHIEIFYAVMIHRSVSGAARMLNLSQPAATRLLQHAEYQWGFPLFERVKNRLVPTAAAQQLFPEIERVYQSITGIRHQINHLRYNERQHIRMASPNLLAHELMPLVVNHIRQSFPHAVAEIQNMNSHAIIHQVLEHKVDLGMVYMAIDHPLITTTHLMNNTLYAVYPKHWKFPDELSAFETLSLLSQKPMIHFPVDSPGGQVISTWLDSIGIEISPSIVLDNFFNSFNMVAHGLGWSILDQAVLYRNRKDLDAIQVLALADAPSLMLHLVHANDLVKTPLIECCIEGIRHCINLYFNFSHSTTNKQ